MTGQLMAFIQKVLHLRLSDGVEVPVPVILGVMNSNEIRALQSQALLIVGKNGHGIHSRAAVYIMRDEQCRRTVMRAGVLPYSKRDVVNQYAFYKQDNG